jgi:hypothetical protein
LQWYWPIGRDMDPGTGMAERTGSRLSRLCCTTVAVLFLASAARAEIVVGPEIDLPFLAGAEFPSLALLDDGSFAIAGWQLVQMQAYSRDGLPAGAPLVPQPYGTYGGVGSLGISYFLSWQHLALATGAPRTLAEIVSRGGEPLAGPLAWPNSEIDDYFLYYRFGGGPDHAFVPVFYHQDGVNQFDNPIWIPSLLEYGDDARATGHLVMLAKLQPNWLVTIDDVGVNGDGRIAVMSDQCPINATLPQQCGRGLQIFGPSGRAATPLLTDGVPQPLNRDGAAVGLAALGIDPQGKVLVMWGIGVSTSQLEAQLFNREGAAISGLMSVAPLDEDAGLLKVRAIGDGQFALAYLVLHEDGSIAIRVSEFQAGIGFAEPVTIVSRIPLTSVGSGFVSLLFEANTSGHGIVAWRTIDEKLDFHGHAKVITFNLATARADGAGQCPR